jgi:hypothetical protein
MAPVLTLVQCFIMEPISHFFYSDRLKLQFWDYGRDGRPSLVLVHGGLDRTSKLRQTGDGAFPEVRCYAGLKGKDSQPPFHRR